MLFFGYTAFLIQRSICSENNNENNSDDQIPVVSLQTNTSWSTSGVLVESNTTQKGLSKIDNCLTSTIGGYYLSHVKHAVTLRIYKGQITITMKKGPAYPKFYKLA